MKREIYFPSYRQVFCLASTQIQPKEGKLLPRSLEADFGMTRSKENIEKDMRFQINMHLNLRRKNLLLLRQTQRGHRPNL